MAWYDGVTAELLLETGPVEVSRRALAVVAHPDDESFGLGAILGRLVDGGWCVDVLCLTHGEASSLSAHRDLAVVRMHEVRAAATELGVIDVWLCDFADGGLGSVDPIDIDREVEKHVNDAAMIVVFEPEGVTGHPDHRAATQAGLRAANRHQLAALEWGLEQKVAEQLGKRYPPFSYLVDGDDTATIELERTRQRRAIACHASQLSADAVVWERLSLQGNRERVRLVRPALSR